MENAEMYGIDLSAKDDIGCTAFHYAFARNLDVFQLFMENAAALSIDLNSQSEYGWTAFILHAEQVEQMWSNVSLRMLPL